MLFSTKKLLRISSAALTTSFELLLNLEWRRCWADSAYIYNENKRIMTQFEHSNENLSFDFVQFFALIIEVKRQAKGQ